MSKIRIIRAPDGDAPLHVRDAWVGLVLPCIVMVPPELQPVNTVSGKQAAPVKLYAVANTEAIQVLKKTNAKAAPWWESNPITATLPYLGFQEAFCELIEP